MSDKELKQTLREIKDNCHAHKDCEGCIFNAKFGCRLKWIPSKWSLAGFHLDKWHKLFSWLVDVRAASVSDARDGLKDYTIGQARVKLLDDILEYMNELDEEEDDEA